ncbi:hypothetical protein BU16DRAFT_565688 [Lophium mytilinum]|uniref:Uncharacterized protein n=1 Tax=Lophium mytilinum TaxID=390894 RepID=A0A6A6QEE3_9PEZI|nr:hypothetical protein BU16DRAFT_565688 [Lophium mytilinum]
MVNIPGIGVTILTYLLTIPLLLFYSLLLAGCVSTSPGIPNLHLVELRINEQFRVREGYYGLCVFGSGGPICVSTGFSSKAAIIDKLRKASQTQISEAAVDESIKLQTGAFINVLSIGTVLFLFSLLLDLLRIHSTKRVRKGAVTSSTTRRQNFYRQVSLTLAWGASAFTLAAAVANTQTGHAAEIISNGKITLGQASVALHWVTWAISLIFCYGWTMLLRTRSGAAKDPSASGSGSGTGSDDFTPMGSGQAAGGVVTL